MSSKCNICEKTFKYPYLLKRHQNKKIKCKMSENMQNELNKRVNTLEEIVEKIQENIQQDCKDHNDNNLYKCTYCFETFSRSDSLSRHLSKGRCRGKNNNIEIYEKELGISKPEQKHLTCRFCNITFSKLQ